MTAPDYANPWFARSIAKHDIVRGTRTLSDGRVEIDRRGLAPLTAVALRNDRIDEDTVQRALEAAIPTTLVLVPKSGHYDWNARDLASRNGSSILTMKEFYTALRDPDPRSHLDSNVAYNLARLGEHARVVGVDLICESCMFVQRSRGMSDVTVAVEYEYEFGHEAMVGAIARHPEADIVLNANPNGAATAAAHRYAHEAGRSVFRLAELMGALHHDGDRLRDYVARGRR